MGPSTRMVQVPSRNQKWSSSSNRSSETKVVTMKINIHGDCTVLSPEGVWRCRRDTWRHERCFWHAYRPNTCRLPISLTHFAFPFLDVLDSFDLKVIGSSTVKMRFVPQRVCIGMVAALANVCSS